MAISSINTDGGLTIIGDRLLIAKIDKLIAMGARRSQIRAAYNRASKPLRMAARNNAKRNKLTGTLWRSIKMLNSRKNRSLFWIGPASGRRHRYDGWYGYFIEKGTRTRKTKSGASRGKIKGGSKYMERAYNATKGKARLNIIGELNKLINKIANAQI